MKYPLLERLDDYVDEEVVSVIIGRKTRIGYFCWVSTKTHRYLTFSNPRLPCPSKQSVLFEWYNNRDLFRRLERQG